LSARSRSLHTVRWFSEPAQSKQKLNLDMVGLFGKLSTSLDALEIIPVQHIMNSILNRE
jgi:hypothetical protein